MTGTKMIASIKLITSYKVDASEEDAALIDTMIDLYQGYYIPSRRTVINICASLTSSSLTYRVKGRQAFNKLKVKCQIKSNKIIDLEPSDTSSIKFNIADSDDETDDTKSYSSEYEFSSEYEYKIDKSNLITNFEIYDLLSTERLRAQGIVIYFTNI